jgi:hypothetical protein
MGKKSGPAAPAAPDPKVIIPLQTKANLEQFNTMLSAARSGSTNPFGSSSWTKTAGIDGAPDQWAFSRQFSPEVQGNWDSVQRQIAGRLSDMESGSGGYSPAVAQALYDRASYMFEPQFAQQQRSTEQRLAERGFQVGNEGYDSEMDRLNQATGRARTDAANAAVAGSSEQWRQDLAALLAQQTGMAQGLNSNPDTFQVPTLQGVDVMGAYDKQYQAQYQAYAQEMQARQSQMGLLGQLGGAALTAFGGPIGAGIGSLFGGAGSAYSLASAPLALGGLTGGGTGLGINPYSASGLGFRL